MAALLLCLCLICSNLVSAAYAAGVDGSGTGQAAGSGAAADSSGQSGGSSEDGGNEDGAPENADTGNGDGAQENTGTEDSSPEEDGNADGAAGGQTQDTVNSTDSVGAGTVIVGANGINGSIGTAAGEYKLYITHVLAVDGYLFADENVAVGGGLTAEALSGGYDVLQNAYTRPGMAVTTDRLTVTAEDFDENKACYVEIVYHVADGYKATYTLPQSMARSIYIGKIDDVTLEPANTVEVRLEYRFHESTGMSGLPAHSYDQRVLKMDGDGNYTLEQTVPVSTGTENLQLDGLWVVLDPKPMEDLMSAYTNPASRPDPVPETAFNTALSQSRTVIKTGTANGGQIKITYSYDAATNLLTASIPRDAVDTKDEELLTLTVYYFRWTIGKDPGWYGVRYEPIGVSPTTPLKQPEYHFGKVGALTDFTMEADDQIIVQDGKTYVARGIAQQRIEETETDATQPKTWVNVYYDVCDPDLYQVIYDTDNGTFVDSASCKKGGYVKLPNETDDNLPTKTGYKFAGWQYRNKSGSWVTLEAGVTPGYNESSNALVLEDSGFLNAVQLEPDTDDVNVICLKAAWTMEASTRARVEFWTENLDTDPTKNAVRGNSAGGSLPTPTPSISGGSVDTGGYSYAGGFTVGGISTSDALKSNAGSDTLDNPVVQGDIEEAFQKIIGFSDAPYYEYQTVLCSDAVAKIDGSTVIYVFYTRKTYNVRFAYYHMDGSSYLLKQYQSTASWPEPGATVSFTGEMNSSQYFWITAKYGADLQEVWPSPANMTGTVAVNGTIYRPRAWYLEPREGETDQDDYITDLYSSMDAELIVDPEDTAQYRELTACWENSSNLRDYRYNYCLEVPDLDPQVVKEHSDVFYDLTKSTKITQRTAAGMNGTHDLMYLVNDIYFNTGAVKYDTSKYMKADQMAEESASSNAYLVRIHDNKCYVVLDRVLVKGGQEADELTAGSRAYMELINEGGAADYVEYVGVSEIFQPEEYANRATGLKLSPDSFLDCFFYYSRKNYTITYLVNNKDNMSVILGTLGLPYGTMLDEVRYGFASRDGKGDITYDLDCTKKNGDYAVGAGSAISSRRLWTMPVDENGQTASDRLVCPARSASETKYWELKGWESAPTGGEQLIASDRPLDNNIRVYALWEAQNYTVTFDLNGGTLPGVTDLTGYEVQELGGGENISANGKVLQPVRLGYDLSGWLVTSITLPGSNDASRIYTYDQRMRGYYNKNGQKYNVNLLPADYLQPDGSVRYSFDMDIFADLKVQAQWTVDKDTYGHDSVDYIVHYYVLDGYQDGKPVAKVKASGQPIRVADDKVVTNIPYITTTGGMWAWEQPAMPEGEYSSYAATAQQSGVLLSSNSADNVITFYYAENKELGYYIQYVNYRKQEEVLWKSDEPITGYYGDQFKVPVYPDQDIADQLGCRLVDANGNVVTKEEELLQEMVLLENAGDNVFTFYLDPIRYTITYRGLNLYYESGAADLGNPTGYYTIYHTGELKNPTQFTGRDGVTYEFQGWRLVDPTTQWEGSDFSGSDLSTNVVIERLTKGDLIFEAVWDKELPGKLDVSKLVRGSETTSEDRNKSFTFTVRLYSGTPLAEDDLTFSCTGVNIVDGVGAPTMTNNKLAFTEAVGTTGDTRAVYSATFSLKHGQCFSIYGLPKGMQYDVEEAEANTDDMRTTYTNQSGTIESDLTADVSCLNQRGEILPDGTLDVAKVVSGLGGSLTDEFTFTISLTAPESDVLLNRYNYTGSRSGVMNLTRGVGTIKLCNGEHIQLELPAGTAYTVTESNPGEYVVSSEDETGTIATLTTSYASYTNYMGSGSEDEVGDLVIGKTVLGSKGETDREFQFTVALADSEGRRLASSYTYSGSKTGEIQDGGVIALKGGETVTIANLPVGAQYTVTESEANQDGYTTISSGETGTISSGIVTSRAAFTNYRETDPDDPDNPDDPNNPDDPDNPNGGGDDDPNGNGGGDDDPNGNGGGDDDPNGNGGGDDDPNGNGTGGNGTGGNGSSGAGGSARTGDAGHLTQWLALLELSMGGFLILLIVYLVRRNRHLG